MLKILLLWALPLLTACAWAHPEAAARLQAKYLALDSQLKQNQYMWP